MATVLTATFLLTAALTRTLPALPTLSAPAAAATTATPTAAAALFALTALLFGAVRWFAMVGLG